MATLTTADQVAEIERLTGNPVTYAGGGRGQRARVVYGGRTHEAAASSRGMAVSLLYNEVIDDLGGQDIEAINDEIRESGAESVQEWIDAGAKVERETIDGIMAKINTANGKTVDLIEADEDTTPGPKWHGKVLVSIVPCVAECMGSRKETCDCNCGGSNHGILFALMAGQTAMNPVMIGPKPCLCGCGGITQRRFVPGHDARYHAALKRAAKEAAAAAEAGAQ